MLTPEYTQGWDRMYRGIEQSSIATEYDRLATLVEAEDLSADLIDIKTRTDDEGMGRYDDTDVLHDVPEEDVLAVAAEYSGDAGAVRLEYDSGTVLEPEFRLYVEGDELFVDEVTAAMEARPEPTTWKQVRDLFAG